MHRGLKLSCPLIVNMILFVIIGNFLKLNSIFITTFSIAHWDALDDNFVF